MSIAVMENMLVATLAEHRGVESTGGRPAVDMVNLKSSTILTVATALKTGMAIEGK